MKNIADNRDAEITLSQKNEEGGLPIYVKFNMPDVLKCVMRIESVASMQ